MILLLKISSHLISYYSVNSREINFLASAKLLFTCITDHKIWNKTNYQINAGFKFRILIQCYASKRPPLNVLNSIEIINTEKVFDVNEALV